MRILLLELKRIFERNPLGIIQVFSMDVAEIILASLNPFVMGLCIDSLFNHKYHWLYALIALQLIYIFIRYVNKTKDTKIYENIIEEESNAYYDKAIQETKDNSIINSRLELVSTLTTFFDTTLVEIIDILGSIVVALGFLFYYSGLFLFVFASIISALVYFLTKNFRFNIAEKDIILQNYDEQKGKFVSSRNGQRFRKYTKANRELRIQISDLDSKMYLLTDALQAALLIFSMISTISTGGHTAGELFSIISYIIMLNESVCSIHDIRIQIYDLVDTAKRLNGKDNMC